MLNRINATIIFCIGLFICLMLVPSGLMPAPATFIHFWPVELPTAVFFALCCGYLAIQGQKRLRVTQAELAFVVAPVICFILWSFISSVWAVSWKSAIHHSLVWVLYLTFYLISREIIETNKGGRILGSALLGPILLFSLAAIAGYISLVIFGAGIDLGRLGKVGEQAVTILPLLLVVVARSSGRRLQIGVVIVSLLWLLIFCTLGRINFFLFAIVSVITAVLTLTSRDVKVGPEGAAGLSGSPDRNWRFRLRRLVVIAAACLIAPMIVQSFSLLSPTPDVTPVAFQRFGDQDNVTSSNNFRRLMYAISQEMIATNLVLGIGADNFGFRVNDYRRIYSEKYPDEVSLREAENNLPERAHNEFLQIFAELGIPGVAIVCWFIMGFLVLCRRGFKAWRGGSILGPAAVIGLGAFLISSMVSSYSFRFVQNGFVFFFVLALAFRELVGRPNRNDAHEEADEFAGIALSNRRFRLLAAAGCAACLVLVAYWGVRVTSATYVIEGNQTQDLHNAEKLYAMAEKLDDENPDARYFHGMRLFQEHRFAEAAPYLAESIRMGRGRSADYSYLASALSLAGDDVGAENVMAEAFAMYPQSAFVLTRYSLILATNGKTRESERMLARARTRQSGDANAWWILLTEGTDRASTEAFNHPDQYTDLMDLRPLNALYAVREERFIRFPEERAKFDLFGSNR